MTKCNLFTHGELDFAGRVLIEPLFQKQPSWTVASISDFDAAFFSGLVLAIKPSKIIEVGVASGWGSVVMLNALHSAGLSDYAYFGVDIADRFFYDSQYATGEAVSEMLPSLESQYRLMTGASIGEVASTIGGEVDFAFIDAHHMHPWATLDLLALLPHLAPESWIALHDLSLCRKPDQHHQNRGPKYLYEGWDGEKIHSVQVPTMAGAIKLSSSLESHLPLLIDLLYTPWELTVDQKFVTPIVQSISTHFGSEWGHKLERATEIGNYFAHKMHASDPVKSGLGLKSFVSHPASRLSRLFKRFRGI
jgi:predicted O-methyltransferase YrrM